MSNPTDRVFNHRNERSLLSLLSDEDQTASSSVPLKRHCCPLLNRPPPYIAIAMIGVLVTSSCLNVLRVTNDDGFSQIKNIPSLTFQEAPGVVDDLYKWFQMKQPHLTTTRSIARATQSFVMRQTPFLKQNINLTRFAASI
jgi:hypothetical protein